MLLLLLLIDAAARSLLNCICVLIDADADAALALAAALLLLLVESSDMVQAKDGELGLNQIGYGHDVNMYVCLRACTSIYAILLQCLCCLLLPL